MKEILRSIYKSFLFELIPHLSNFFLQRKIILPKFTLTRKLPINYKPEDYKSFEGELIRECNDVTLVRVKNAILNIHQAIVVKNFSVIEESLMHPNIRSQYGLKFLVKSYLKPKNLIHGNQFLLVYNHYAIGYGHWLSDVIPRLYMIRDCINDYKIALPKEYNSFHIKALEPFDIAPDNILYLEADEWCKIDNLTIVSHVGTTCNVKDSILQSVRKFYYDHYKINSLKTVKRRIYVSRSKTPRRFVLNEIEVIELLKKFNFEVIHFQEYEFQEQIRIASETEIMIGLTGSGLNNMMFMPSNSKVLEFKMKGDYHNLHYFGFASGLELDYYYLLCTPVGEDRFNSDFIVDIANLEAAITQMIL
ncbi:MAG: glycosyltransferase family 61 protein [Nostocales cyanobacterium W4_Combined_metabat2_030]|jgi:hypothetical protein|nr:glycosyltransferase family 61 protein [Nostocales cyanobacterium W4_Combined_metabat2_030]